MIEFTTQNTREHIAHLLNEAITTVLSPSGDDRTAAFLLAKASGLMRVLTQPDDDDSEAIRQHRGHA